MEERLKALHLIFGNNPIYAIDDVSSSKKDVVKSKEKLISTQSEVCILLPQVKDSISSIEQEFLSKILTAAKIDSPNFTHKTIDYINTKYVIGLGVNAFEFGLQDVTFNKYELKEYQSTHFLFADSLSIIMKDKNKKEALWMGMRRMFNL